MSEHERHALHHPRIAEFHKFYSEYHVYFDAGAERFKVMFRVFESSDGRFFFEQSHFISTPRQEAFQMPPRDLHEHPHLALQRGIESITTFYDDAVDHGHEPCATWFIRNELY